MQPPVLRGGLRWATSAPDTAIVRQGRLRESDVEI
jgi:hypothetical protein